MKKNKLKKNENLYKYIINKIKLFKINFIY